MVGPPANILGNILRNDVNHDRVRTKTAIQDFSVRNIIVLVQQWLLRETVCSRPTWSKSTLLTENTLENHFDSANIKI